MADHPTCWTNAAPGAGLSATARHAGRGTYADLHHCCSVGTTTHTRFPGQLRDEG